MVKVLHVFYSFFPDLSGSSIRSAGIIRGQAMQGMKVAAVSSPFQPGPGPGSVDEFHGVRVYRAYRPGAPHISETGSTILARFRKVSSFPRFVWVIRKIAKKERAAVIHAHSTFYCALAAYLAARSLGIKVIYEFRSLWEERARDLSVSYRIQAALSRFLESLSLRVADRVVAINETLKREIVARGVRADRVDVVPNAVDDELIERGSCLEPPVKVRRFGYIGNLSKIEGLDALVAAFKRAFPGDEDVELLFHGFGAYEPELRRLIEAAGDPRIRVCGPFSRDEVESVYRTVDCIVLPRRRSKLNDTVTPLKPLEAMAFKRLVCVSDARGLLEVIGDRANACVFAAGNVQELASLLRRIYLGEINAREVATRGHEFVRRHRAWNAVARAYSEIYAKC